MGITELVNAVMSGLSIRFICSFVSYLVLKQGGRDARYNISKQTKFILVLVFNDSNN